MLCQEERMQEVNHPCRPRENLMSLAGHPIADYSRETQGIGLFPFLPAS